MTLKMTLKMVVNEMILALDLTTNQNIMKGPCLEFVSRILIWSLTLRQPIT